MRVLLFIISLFVSFNALGLGGYETLSGDDKKVTDSIKDKLHISKTDAYEIYEIFLKANLNTKNWQVNYYDNDTLDSTKVGKSQSKTVFVNFVTDNRYVNISFVKFPSEKQILIQLIETLPRGSQVALDKYNSLKSDTTWKINSDSAEFSAFTKNGSSSKVKILVNSGVGGIQYIDFYTFDLN